MLTMYVVYFMMYCSFEIGVPGFGRVIVNAKPLCNCDCQQNAVCCQLCNMLIMYYWQYIRYQIVQNVEMGQEQKYVVYVIAGMYVCVSHNLSIVSFNASSSGQTFHCP